MKINLQSAARFRALGSAAVVGPPPGPPGGGETGPFSLALTPATGAVVGQAVHFKVSPLSMNALASAAGVSRDDYEAECEWLWEFSVGNSAENYAFTALPADHMGGKEAGRALGRFAAHVYTTPGTHTARCTLYRRGTLVGTATTEIVISQRSYAVAVTGYCNPDGATAGADGIPVGANVFTDINAAFAWVSAADGRALFLRRGKQFLLTTIGHKIMADMMIAAYDASGPHGTTGARPKITVDAGYPTARLSVVGNGTQQTYTATKSLAAKIYVYFDNVLQTEGVGYTRGVDADSDKITATVPSGVTMRVFNRGTNDSLEISGMVLNAGAGKNGAIIRDIEADGQYDPVNPGYFDNTDLSTANRFAEILFIGSGSGTNSFITVFRCKVNRFNCNMQIINSGDMIAAVDCNFDEWANYGFYISNCTRVISVGCSMVQNRLTWRGGKDDSQAKLFNTPIQYAGSVNRARNAPWHGPLRCPYSVEQVLNSCRMDSRNSWAGDDALAAQPNTRMAASVKPGQNYSYTQCHTTGGWGCFSGGSANQNITASRYGMAYVGYNVFTLYPGAQKFGGGQIYVTSVSNVYYVPAGTGATGFLNFYGYDEDSPYIVANDVRQEPWRSINDTFLVLDQRASTLRINPASTLASPGLQNVFSLRFWPTDTNWPFGGYPVPPEAVGTATVRVPMKIAGTTNNPNYSTRIWRGATEPAATAAATITAQRAIYDFQYEAAPLNDDSTSKQTKVATYIDVTLKSGTWAAGDIVWITREQTVETAGAVEVDDETGEETLVGAESTPETFFTNNRTVPLVRPPAQLSNSLVLIPSPWTTIIRDEAVVTDTTPYLPATYGSFDGYWRPGSGNSAIGAASGVRAAFDVRGKLRAQASLGALEPDTDVTGWPALPTVPTVEVALSPATYTEGDGFGASNVSVTITAPGTPALTAGDVVKLPEVLDANNAVVSTTGSASLAVGQKVRGSAIFAHQTLPRRVLPTPSVDVASANFAPVWINSNPDLAAAPNTARNGARINRSGLTAPAANVNQHIAFRLRSRHDAALAGTVRLFVAQGTSPEFSLRLNSTGVLTAHSNATVIATLGTIPATNGTASVLVSSYRAGDGPGGVFMRAQIKIGTGAVQTIDFGTSALALFGTQIRIFSNTQGVPDVDFRQYFGTWTGGLPTWDTFFAPDGEVRQWAADPSLGIGLVQHNLFNGVGDTSQANTFNGHLDTLTPLPRLWIEGQA